MAEHMLLNARRIDDRTVQVEQGLAIREIERRVSMHLSPDEHILCRERNLLISLTNIRQYRTHDLVFRQIDLRIEIRHTEFAAASTPGCHLDNAKCRSGIGEHDRVAVNRMLYDNFTRNLFLTDRFRKQIQRIGRFASTVNDAVDAKLVVQVSLDDLPTARSANDHFEIVSIIAALDLGKKFTRVMRVDRHLRRAEHGRINTCCKGHTKWIVRRDTHNTCPRADEFIEILRVA